MKSNHEKEQEMRSTTTPQDNLAPRPAAAVPAPTSLVDAAEAAWRTGLAGCGETLVVLLREQFPTSVVTVGDQVLVDLAELGGGPAPVDLCEARITGSGFVR